MMATLSGPVAGGAMASTLTVDDLSLQGIDLSRVELEQHPDEDAERQGAEQPPRLHDGHVVDAPVQHGLHDGPQLVVGRADDELARHELADGPAEGGHVV